MKTLATTLLSFILINSSLYASDHTAAVRLAMDNRPPFHYMAHGTQSGVALKKIQCAFDRLEKTYRLEVTNWKRSQHLVKSGHADGFFAASHNNARDQYATLSFRFVDQYWSWFTLKSTAVSPAQLKNKQIKVSSWRGSNSQRWLKKNGYKVSKHPPQNMKKLVASLRSGKLKAIFGSNIAINDHLKQLGIKDQVQELKVLHKPMGIYFSHRFLKHRPAFLKEFNAAVKQCP